MKKFWIILGMILLFFIFGGLITMYITGNVLN
ncbi:hypothetical protein RKD55_000124 [Rossellomorea marisflavi]